MSGCAEPTKPAGLRPQSQSRTAQTAGPHVKVSPSVHPSSRQSSHVVKTFAARPSRSSSSCNLMSRPCHVSVTSASHRDRRHVNDISASRRRCVGVTSASSQRHVGVTSVSRRCHVDVIVTRLPYQSLPVSATSARAEHVRWARALPTYPPSMQSPPSRSVWVACGRVTC